MFTIAGFGTVVTGTLTDGTLHVGQEVVVEPGGLRSRIRGLQSHKHKVESIGPGNRVAVNLAGVDVDELRRGMVLTTPGWLEPTSKVDIYLNLLADAPRPCRTKRLARLLLGLSETVAASLYWTPTGWSRAEEVGHSSAARPGGPRQR